MRKPSLQLIMFLALLVTLGAQALAQSQASARIEFDVSSVKPNMSGRLGHDGFRIAMGNLTVRNVSVKMLIEAAYGVQASRIAGGPAWLSADRYDVTAKGATTAGEQQVWLMLRSLLADRFQLVLRNDTKELPIYALQEGHTKAKLLKREDAVCKAADPSKGPNLRPCGMLARVWGPQGGFLSGQKVTMSALADALSGFLDRPVIDRSGLAGAFDVELQWTPDGYKPPVQEAEGRPPLDATEPGPSIFAAVQEQLGLKLAASKGPVQILIIDHAAKPTQN